MANLVIQRAIEIAGSQQKLADRCGVSQPTVFRWLNGGGISSRYVQRIVSATGAVVTTEDVLNSTINSNQSA
ncbi:YdaS family helix-turn-helix protein [Pluralibacter gergoviae]|uniref:transcriptional regulator n=1 Tax=Pluralibacter gergoviae TaxID=61647 RepID=UPI00093B7931|nr:YdaS family helix-turn-helix protein [Pluralibacter gergoviae]SUB71829.1 Uncharacterized protein conserved in bacteria, prophage-related [Pluralibacter gergoviae]